MTATVTDLATERARRRSPGELVDLRRLLEARGAITTSTRSDGYVPPRARMTFDEWLRAVEAEPIGHSAFCPHLNDRTVNCACVSCHCTTFVPGGELGTCGRCRRPLVRDGRVIR